MRVVAFAPSLVAVEAEDGGLNANGFPMTSCYVEEMPAEITIPVVIAVCGLAGEECDAVRYLIATSPQGEKISTMQFGWQWQDDPELPVEYQVFVQRLPVQINQPGIYTLGLYQTAEGGDTPHSFPLPIFEANDPFLAPRSL